MFKKDLAERIPWVMRLREGACGICYAVADGDQCAGGSVVAYEQPGGILAEISNNRGRIIGKGKGVVW